MPSTHAFDLRAAARILVAAALLLPLTGCGTEAGDGGSPGEGQDGIAGGAETGPAAGSASGNEAAAGIPDLEVWMIDAAGDVSRLVRWREGEDGFEEMWGALADGARGLVHHPGRDELIWSSRDGDGVFAARMNSDADRRLPVEPLDSAYALAVDTLTGRLWLSDYGRDEILSFAPDGSDLRVAVDGLVAPRQIALDVDGGWVYWVDRGAGRVQRRAITAGGDGTGPVETLIDSGLPAPYGIVLDPFDGTLLVGDAELGSIFRIDPANPLLEPWLPEAGTHPSFLAIDPVTRVLWWTDNRDNVLRRRPLEGGETTVVVGGLAGPRGLVLLRR